MSMDVSHFVAPLVRVVPLPSLLSSFSVKFILKLIGPFCSEF
jgi:hypothetical protein